MSINLSDKIKLIAAFGAVLLTAIIHLGIREWYSPDIRYEEGSYYIAGKSAITSLKLKNVGHYDAEDIIIHVRFSFKLSDISVDNPTVTLKQISGGVGFPFYCGQVLRLVPDQEIFIYFAVNIENQIYNSLPKNFVSNITFKGGKGKTGAPIMFPIIFIILIYFLIGTISLIFFKRVAPQLTDIIANYLFRESFDAHFNKIDDIISFTIDNKNLSENEFLDKIDNEVKEVEFRKKTLKEIAIRLLRHIKTKS